MTGPRRRRATPAAPRTPTNTEQQLAREKKLRDEAQAKTRRVSFRVLMALGHGCTGRSCPSARHQADLSALRDSLMALGIIPDQGAQWELGLGYKTSQNRRRAVNE